MHLRHFSFAALIAGATAQQQLVVPATYATTDANSFVWVPGACDDVRQQTLIGASHLTALVGHAITGFALRRTAANELYDDGTADLTVTMSTVAHDPLECSKFFAANVGANAMQVFAGSVTIPSSPATTGTTVAWTTDNIVLVTFQTPFPYTGGTLCLDVVGTKVAGQIAQWWMADAVWDLTSGSAVDIGPGCGPHANAAGQWSFVDEKTMLPGAVLEQWAYGPVGNWAVGVMGAAGPAVPLSLFNLGQPGCNAYLSTIEMMNIAPFMPLGDPLLAHRGGRIDWEMQIPNLAWVLNAQMTTQWLDVFALHSSNAIAWNVASTAPSLNMALCDGVATDSVGNVTTFLAHVVRFDYL